MPFNDSDAYGQFMGRFSEPLAAQLASTIAARPGQRALDVGCGTGALTARFVDVLGVESVRAIDPSPPFIERMHERFPDLDSQVASAESIPFEDQSFDIAAAQLVVHFMTDPVAGIREMARVTRPGGTVAASVWDHGGDTSPLALFWKAAKRFDHTAKDGSELAGATEGHLQQIFVDAGVTEVLGMLSTVRVEFTSFDEWWQPYLLGVGPAGEYVNTLDADAIVGLRAECARLLPDGPFGVDASAWVAIGRAAG
ncbi:MAG: Methyltransferase type 11 [Microbacteriaceae bacterium]|nr:Methyltransferase type 11 [Microbacteriaceae bacterium]